MTACIVPTLPAPIIDMFVRIDLAGLPQSGRFGYAADLGLFRGLKTLEFRPGLNILYGPKGCGISLVLRMLGEHLCATQRGMSTLNEATVRDMLTAVGGEVGVKDDIGLKIVHDGQPVVYCDTRHNSGQSSLGPVPGTLKRTPSTDVRRPRRGRGEAGGLRADRVFAILEGREPPPGAIRRVLNRRSLNPHRQAALVLLEERLEASCDIGQQTILLDGPDADLSLVDQAKVWKLLSEPAVSERFQVIVSTQSPIALGLPDDRYIDLIEGHRDGVWQLVKEHVLRFAAEHV